MPSAYEGTDIISYLQSKYIMRQRRISYCVSDISLKNIAFYDIMPLKGCMTCRHGNMCPYGNKENQLICTKDITITSKEDMLDLFDQTDPFEERAVTSLDFCEDFVCQSDDYYTYNDYFYQLSRKMADK